MSENSVPKFQEIVNYIKNNIDNKIYEKGCILPSEKEFCNQFGTSRMTVRRAIDELVQSGWLYRVHGRGTFVSHFELQKSYLLHGFTENMIRLGCRPSSRVLAFELKEPEAYIAEQLKSLPTEKVYFLYRVRLVDHEPIALEKAYLPENRFPGLPKYSFQENSLYGVLRRYYDAEIK